MFRKCEEHKTNILKQYFSSDIRRQPRDLILQGMQQFTLYLGGGLVAKFSWKIVGTLGGDASKGSFVDYSADNVRNNITKCSRN